MGCPQESVPSICWLRCKPRLERRHGIAKTSPESRFDDRQEFHVGKQVIAILFVDNAERELVHPFAELAKQHIFELIASLPVVEVNAKSDDPV